MSLMLGDGVLNPGSRRRIETDVLVVGAGIAGLQASLDLADQGYRVLLVEREASTGGHMIGLSKVFLTIRLLEPHHDPEDVLLRRTTTW